MMPTVRESRKEVGEKPSRERSSQPLGSEMPEGNETGGKLASAERGSVCALNLKHSPEKWVFWERADPIIAGAGETGSALQMSTDRHPGVSYSIELHNGKQSTRRATIKGSWGSTQREYPSMCSNVKRGAQMAASRVMGTGTLQKLAKTRGNARRVKVPTAC